VGKRKWKKIKFENPSGEAGGRRFMAPGLKLSDPKATNG
jgi:hypothetical protein